MFSRSHVRWGDVPVSRVAPAGVVTAPWTRNPGIGHPEDAGVADRPVGQFAIAGASLGELSPVILLSLFFSGRAIAIGPKLLLLSLLGVLVVLVVIATLRIERSMWITRMINKLADTSAQIRIRLSMLLVVGLGAVATHLGLSLFFPSSRCSCCDRLLKTRIWSRSRRPFADRLNRAPSGSRLPAGGRSMRWPGVAGCGPPRSAITNGAAPSASLPAGPRWYGPAGIPPASDHPALEGNWPDEP